MSRDADGAGRGRGWLQPASRGGDGAGGGRGWLQPAIVSVSALSVAAGFSQFGVTAVLGDVARTFGAAGPEEPLASRVGMAASQLGIGLAVVRLASIGSLLGSALADRFGRRRVILLAAALGLLLTASAGASPGFWWFVALAAAGRPLLSTTNAVAGVIVSEETVSADRAKAVALVSAAYGLGSGLVALVRGIGGLDFRTVLFLSLVPLALLPLLARRVVEPSLVREAAGPRLTLPGAVHPALRARLALVCGLTLGMAVVTGPVFTYLFVVGENVLGASPGTMAGLVVAAGPAGLGGLLLGRLAADRLGRRVTAGTTMALTAVGGVVAYTGALPQFAVGYLVTILVSGAFAPAAGALTAEVFPTSMRATAAGWAAASGVIGAVVGIAAFGLLADALGGFGAAAVVLAAPVAAASVLFARLPETVGLELDQSAPEPE